MFEKFQKIFFSEIRVTLVLSVSLKNNIERTRISRWLGRENEENVARTRD